MPMKTLFSIIITFCVAFCISNCTENKTNSSQSESDSLQILKKRVSELELQIQKLQFPADQRLNKIKDLIAKEELDSALYEIKELKSCFPESEETKSTIALTEEINKKKAEIEEEKQRIKALGFKALQVAQSVTISENTVLFSNCQIGAKYTHDVYPTYGGTEWREHTADKGSKFISFNMDVTSTSKNPNIPTVAFYLIEGEKLIYKDVFWVNFARWSDYGCYLGNEPDLKNDFSKVNTVKFKVGLSLEDINFTKPYMIVLKKANKLARYTHAYDDPPVTYSGDMEYPSSLSIDDFNNGEYVAIKIANL